MDLFRKQFIGNMTWYALAGIVITHVLAIFVRDSAFALPALIIIGVLTLYISFKSLPHGLFIGFVEVFTGGHGHLIDTEIFGFSLSIRMVIFAAVMFGWLILIIRKQTEIKIIKLRDLPWVTLITAIAVGTAIGFINNEPMKVFDDMNGYLAIGYILPLLSINWNSVMKRDLLHVLFGSAIWLVFFTLLLSALFNHLDGKTSSHVYTFVRDARLAEITLQKYEDPNFEDCWDLCAVAEFEGEIPACCGSTPVIAYGYRIFMQSQFFLVTTILIIFAAMLFIWRSQRAPAMPVVSFVFISSALILSLSRSFALGLAAGGAMLIALSFFHGKKSLPNVSRRLLYSVILAGFGASLVIGTALIPPKPDITDASFYQSSDDGERELAISSRWQLLPEMMKSIAKSPIIGSGFGTEVTFISDDPRVRAINPSGEWTTYRFEWGYQDIWLKMGVLGLIAFGWYAVLIFQAIRFTMKKHGHVWLTIGFGAGVLALFVANVFTPFLNHPIGIITMLLIIPFLDFEGMEKQAQEARQARKVKKGALEMSPAMIEAK